MPLTLLLTLILNLPDSFEMASGGTFVCRILEIWEQFWEPVAKRNPEPMVRDPNVTLEMNFEVPEKSGWRTSTLILACKDLSILGNET